MANNNHIIPQHIAIICDGNRRYAKSHGWEVIKGHEYAFDKIFSPLARHASKLGVKYLTFWVFSTENWDRDQYEVDALMNIFRNLFDKKAKELEKENVRIKIIGDLSRFDQDIQEKVTAWVMRTKNNTGITVTFAMNYGGRDEMARAFSKLSQTLNSKLETLNITPELISEYLDTNYMPDPELIVRTSGEQRTSGFLPWQSVYSEWYFPEWHFPEFSPEKLDECISGFNKRQRRFGR